MIVQDAFAERGDGGGPPPGERVACHRNSPLTYVELVFRPGRIERSVRFGRVTEEHRLSHRCRFVAFAPAAVFAYVRWTSNGRGGAVSRLDVLQAVRRSAPCSTISGVTPGAEILLRLSGWPRVQRALRAIDAVETSGIDPADAAPDYWRHVGHRLAAGEAPRGYTSERHAAWLARRALAL
jgi:hypothetical protein